MPNKWTGAVTGAASVGFSPMLAPVAAGAGYLTGKGISMRDDAAEAALLKRQAAMYKFNQRQAQLASGREHAGYAAEQAAAANQLQGVRDQFAFESVRPSEIEANAARSAGLASAFAGDTAGGTADTTALKSAAQKQYATNMAAQMDARTAANLLPAHYAVAQSKVAGEGMRIGDRTDVANATLGQQYNQFQQGQQIGQAEARRDYMSEMADAGFAEEAAKTAGSEQMLYGGLLNAGLNTGFGAVGGMAQATKQSAAQQQQAALQNQIAEYYRRQMEQQNQYYNSRPTAGSGVI